MQQVERSSRLKGLYPWVNQECLKDAGVELSETTEKHDTHAVVLTPSDAHLLALGEDGKVAACQNWLQWYYGAAAYPAAPTHPKLGTNKKGRTCYEQKHQKIRRFAVIHFLPRT